VRARVEGTVQGVGFRPFAHRLARELAVGGWVRNDERGVLLEVEGEPGAVAAFLDRLATDAPPLARVGAVRSEEVAATGERRFAIAASAAAGPPSAPVTPDAPTCEDCLRELRDPADRRHRYPFVNCTNCGPRFTIVRGIPYDRPQTTMAGFAMCPACRAEYDDPADRRFHAQPNACPGCGPRARLVGGAGPRDHDDPVRAAAAALRAGAVVAVKGLGGFHLACRADDEGAVAALRGRKHREDKPFAVMVADADAAAGLVALEADDRALLTGRERPVVVAPRRPGARVAAAVAPRSADLGVMLPYTPLHHLLLDDVGAPLVMTSGNRSDEPIAYRDDDALARLAGIADLVLLHDRPIATRTDDSVVRSGGVLLRRSRGHVPAALALPVPAARPLLACGADLKATFCVARGERAWVSHHIGDLGDHATLRAYAEGVAHFERLFSLMPVVVAHDLHPDHRSTAYALARDGVDHLAVQHHHAHLAACLAEHGERGPAVGAILDGTGYGADGTVWGGELLVGALADARRAGHLWPVRLPGGDRAAREPWRMACAWLVAAGDDEVPAIPAALAGAVDPGRWRAVARLARTGVAAPVTTSAGRLFDAVAALCGVRAVSTFEGQAAMELEALADPAERGRLPLPLLERDGALLLDARETVRAALAALAAGIAPAVVAARFHEGLAAGLAEACARIAGAEGLGTVALSGGVFQNRRLLRRVEELLSGRALRVLRPRLLPAGDGGISYGQAAVTAASL
jgi:hydrogenase maturation protein HypF